MVKQLTVIGNSLGLIIDRPILDMLSIDRDTPLEITTDGEALIIRPAALSRSERVKASARKMMRVHEDTLRKLSR